MSLSPRVDRHHELRRGRPGLCRFAHRRKGWKARADSGLLFWWIALILLASLAGCSQPAGQWRGVVSAATPEAAEAGAEILRQGGNAVDAAIAVAFSLAVTEPAMSGLGGQLQMLVAGPDFPARVINGTSLAPSRLPAVASTGAIDAHRATTVPSAVRVLQAAYQRYGSGRVSWRQLLEPAIRQAEQGFVVGPFRSRVWRRYESELAQHPTTRTLLLLPEKRAPRPGEKWRQPVLARTLRRLAQEGGDDFYRGTMAEEIARDMQENGGWLTAGDLAGFPEPQELEPLKGSYRGFTVLTMPPPGGGWVVLQILNMLETLPPQALRQDSANRWRHLALALRIAHRQRRLHPIRNLRNYHTDVETKIDKERARQLLRAEAEGRGETTHFSVVDAGGRVVSVTASINAYFGAKVAHPELGFLYNDYMHEFVLDDPQHPFALKPEGMPYSSMSPTVVVKDGHPVLALGSPGSARIISAVAQVLQLWIDEEQDIRAAVAAPRFHVAADSLLYVEDAALRHRIAGTAAKLGFVVRAPRADLEMDGRNAYFGGVHAVAFEGGRWRGAADPRRDGRVAHAYGPQR